MTEQHTSSLEALYTEAIRQEREALDALQAQDPGTEGSARAWQAWSEAISRTNLAWRELSSYTLARSPHGPPVNARASARGADAPSR